MKLPRFTIAGLMIVVAVVAANAAIARLLYASNPEILIGVAVPVLVLELAMVAAYWSARPGRAFWAGFLLLGCLVMATFIWNIVVPTVYGVTSTGTLRVTPGSPFHPLWSGYGSLVSDLLRGVLEGRVGVDPYDIDVVLLRSIVWTVPQVAGALLGGLVAWIMSLIARRMMNLDR
jgi:hypothetical protein